MSIRKGCGSKAFLDGVAVIVLSGDRGSGLLADVSRRVISSWPCLCVIGAVGVMQAAVGSLVVLAA
ncbi:MAG TPA: hypothetical protein ACQGQJ_03420 [Xylella fastidiosa subsp. multiplex]